MTPLKRFTRFLFRLFAPGRAAQPAKAAPIPRQSARARMAMDNPDLTNFKAFYIERPPDHLGDWRAFDLNDKTLSRVSPTKLLEMLADVSPEISRALWDFMRLCNPGYEVKIVRPGTDEPAGAAVDSALTKMIEKLDDYYGSFDIVISRLFFGAFLRGAMIAEIVLDSNGRDFVDLTTPDPASFYFERVDQPPRGQVWQLGQYQSGKWVRIESELVRFTPIDPFPGSPYGRSAVAPAVFSAIFLIGLMHDLRRVIAQQGYPRVDIEVDLDALEEAMPEAESDDPTRFEAWVNKTIDQIKDVYAELEPDDAYVHTSVTKINAPVGAMSDSSLGIIDELIRSLERFATRALKSMPLFMGSNESVAETHAKLQVELYTAGIKAIQGYAEAMLNRLFSLALQAQGLSGEVRFSFGNLRVVDRLAEAQAESLEIANAAAKRDQGFISQEEAALEVTGSAAVAPEPSTEGITAAIETTATANGHA